MATPKWEEIYLLTDGSTRNIKKYREGITWKRKQTKFEKKNTRFK